MASACVAGSFSPATRRCTCPTGREGPRCESRVIEACRTTLHSVAVACVVARPVHCECIRQCLAHGAFALHLPSFCFTRADGVELSDIEGGATFFQWDRATWSAARQLHFSLASPPAAALLPRRPHLRLVPSRGCPSHCSSRGACAQPSRTPRRREGTCVCDAHYSGEACERHDGDGCWNECSGRGTCVDGFCECTLPFYGPGCALDANRFAASPSRRTRGAPFRVFVYDLPQVVLQRLPFGSDPDPIFNTHRHFMRQLLAHTQVLAHHPSEAHLFFAPAFGTNMEGLLEYYDHAVDHIRTHFPYWERRRGADHFFWNTGDGGGCDLNKRHSTRHSIGVAHYFKFNSSSSACGLLAKDVSVPPFVPAVHTAAFMEAGSTPTSSRALRFFFAGNVPEADQVASRDDGALAEEAYSEGVRQLVWKHLRRAAGFKVVQRSPSYVQDWSASQFCLAPQGVGWGVRLLWAIGAGCIPVIASSQVSPWFDDIVDYDSFTLQGLPKSSLRELPRVLDAITIKEARAMQKRLLRYRKLFLWPPMGYAYNMTLYQLCVRADRSRPDRESTIERANSIRCAELSPIRRSVLRGGFRKAIGEVDLANS
ncbi:hypothetical protein AB1Y20_022793 [Prymnesium parvum]|uniref:EGF-like domain-containing protein n=1 Tax=Prymnesium parvum TaxID=97485 RepID=A0AB34JF78_PRYPA